MAANGFDGPRVQTTDIPASAYIVCLIDNWEMLAC